MGYLSNRLNQQSAQSLAVNAAENAHIVAHQAEIERAFINGLISRDEYKAQCAAVCENARNLRSSSNRLCNTAS